MPAQQGWHPLQWAILDPPMNSIQRRIQVGHWLEFSNILHKFGIVAIFELPKSGNKFDTVINRINFNSIYHDKFRFVLNLIQLLSISILFSLEVIQKRQCCQVCVLWENSSDFISTVDSISITLHNNNPVM